jgi:hypothetical protein
MKFDAGAASRLRTLLETKESSPTQTQPPNRLPTACGCPGQHKDVVRSLFQLTTSGSNVGHGGDRSGYVNFEIGGRVFSCQQLLATNRSLKI